jgi:uncharacterized protein YajQ (UPF0234 family)
MPSFDIESNVDKHEVTNAIDNANRELQNRFDFKGVDAKFEFTKDMIVLTAPDDFQVQQMQDILNSKLTKRGIDILSLDVQPMSKNLAQAKLEIKLKQGIEQKYAKELVAYIKNKKFKVQAAIQGEQVRVTGKDRDELQTVIAALREDKEKFEVPLQFGNFRD